MNIYLSQHNFIRMIIAVDFDGTIVTHKYPLIGEEIPFAIQTLKMLQKEGHKLILWTVREGILLDEAVKFCNEKGLHFYAINENEPNEDITKVSRKLDADLFIDDRNFGGLPDWGIIYDTIKNGRTFCVNFEHQTHKSQNPKKKSFWPF